MTDSYSLESCWALIFLSWTLLIYQTSVRGIKSWHLIRKITFPASRWPYMLWFLSGKTKSLSCQTACSLHFSRTPTPNKAWWSTIHIANKYSQESCKKSALTQRSPTSTNMWKESKDKTSIYGMLSWSRSWSKKVSYRHSPSSRAKSAAILIRIYKAKCSKCLNTKKAADWQWTVSLDSLSKNTTAWGKMN